MKNLLYLIVLAISCSSCTLFKNVSKKNSRTDITLDSSAIRVKKDSIVLQIKKDSSSSSSTTTMDTHTEVTEFDTVLTVPAHSGGVLIVPTDSTRHQFDDGVVETTISTKDGKLQVETKVKERKIPVKAKKTTTDQHYQNKTDTRAGSQQISLHHGSSDSGAVAVHKVVKTKSTEKESKASIKGILTFVFLVLLFLAVIWRLIVFWNDGKFIPWPPFKPKSKST